ncbi:MAG: DUF3604 domain-containing protein [Kiritimatiellae bacterium]|nr:DUF3604 domain-containing protein [Kiritimatiellia bacterium]
MSVKATVRKSRFRVREACSVELQIRTSDPLKPGDTVEVQFPNTWSVLWSPSFCRELQAEQPDAEHYIHVGAKGAGTRFETVIEPRHLSCPDKKQGRHGRCIIATLTAGEVAPRTPITLSYRNTFAPYVAETDSVRVRVRGLAPEREPALTVAPGPAQAFRILAPSGVEPGEEFEVLLVSLDRFDNCSSTRYRDKALKLADGTVVAANLDFTGSTRVAVRLTDEGVYRFVMDETVSNACRVARGVRGPYWGDIHIHTKLSGDGQGTAPYGYARDVSGLDFAGVIDHCESLGREGYRLVVEWAQEAYVPGRFVTILGDERNPKGLTGHHNIYFRDENDFMAHTVIAHPPGKNGQGGEQKMLDSLPPDCGMVIPHHTGISWGAVREGDKGSAVNLDAWDDHGTRPVMEIYSHHGQSEVYAPQHALAYEFNRVRHPGRRANACVPGPYYAQDYWMAGRRLGVIGSSDEHTGQGGRRHGGIAAVWGCELTRDGVFQALRQRRCYATTGEHILVDFTVGDGQMGECIKARPGDKVPVRLQVWGTDLLLRVEILRHRFGVDRSFLPILSVAPRPESMDAEFELEETVQGPCLYYARITQEPLQWPDMAWTSPVWVEMG